MSKRNRKKYSQMNKEERIEFLEHLLKTVHSEEFRVLYKKMLEIEKSA